MYSMNTRNVVDLCSSAQLLSHIQYIFISWQSQTVVLIAKCIKKTVQIFYYCTVNG